MIMNSKSRRLIFSTIGLFTLLTFFWGCETPALKKRHSNNLTNESQLSNNWSTNPSGPQGGYTVGSIQHIAMLLPLSGPHGQAAQAIREGYLAAYYENHGNGSKPNIQMYDTASTNNVVQLYEQAVQNGADFVVGPLSKEHVLQLSQLSSGSLKAPILALNDHPFARSPSGAFIQFSLAPETEVDQITDKAHRMGYRRAAIFVPSNAWGQRLKMKFRSNWERLGGKIVSEINVGSYENLSAQIQKLLAVEESEDRSQAIKNLIKEKVEYQTRRRSDLDVVFMALPPQQARQVKPLFNFYFANDLPIYATSSIYSGTPNPGLDTDINGIEFVDMPGVLDPTRSQTVKSYLGRYSNSDNGESKRLFAMGMDAYQITQSFNQLESSSQYWVNGSTGRLMLGPNNRIERLLSWGTFANGSPKVIQQ